MGAFTCSLLTLLLAGGGAGTKYMETVVQDDAQFLHRPAAQVQQTAQRVEALGADRVRLTASWSSLAPSPRSKRKPAGGFDDADSATYPKGAFTSLDTAVKASTNAGLKVMIDLAFWAPRWAVGRKASNPARERYWPNAQLFADFAKAVAKRYDGDTPDPTNPSKPLPAVRMYTTWNEPNHPSFLMPQWVRTADGGWRPESPHIYRAMHNAAYDAIKSVSRDDLVLVGGTASTGSPTPGTGGVPPLEFARTLACVDENLKPLDVPECANYQPLKADGWAHHPYSRFTTPGTSSPEPDDVPIADVSRLGDLLDTLSLTHRIASRLPIFDTEYGYETSQDDPFQPYTRDEQAEFMGWSTYLAWKDPDTRMFAQFLLRDIDPRESGRKKGTRAYYRDWQTGLYTASDQPKPSVQAFKLPFWAQTQGVGNQRYVMLFGQVRPGKGMQTVQVQRQAMPSAPWTPVRTYGPSCSSNDQDFLTDKAGFFLRGAAFEGSGSYRLGWQHPDGTWEFGVPIPVATDGLQAPPL